MFLLHVDGVIHRWFVEAWKQELANEPSVVARAGHQEFSSAYPNYACTFLNQQLDLLSARLKGEYLIEIIRLTFHKLTDQLALTLPETQKMADSSLYLNVTLRLNNLLVCQTHFMTFREKCIALVTVDRRERAENIINTEYKCTIHPLPVQLSSKRWRRW
jgi:hypothetical protein